MAEVKRLHFVDGLRGVASLMVVLYHLHANLLPAVALWFPHGLTVLFSHFNLGVDVFFVLSGFVITYSVRNGYHTWGYLIRFGLRRSIRLDPPLWITILLELGLIRLSVLVVSGLHTPAFGWRDILSNLTYTQRFFGFREVSPVFWSLTYEVQFYIVLVASFVVWRRVTISREATSDHAGQRPLLPRILFVLAFIYSLLIWMMLLPLPLRGLFIDRWFQFSLGIAACAFFLGRIKRSSSVGLCSIALLLGIFASPDLYRSLTVLVAVATAVALAVVGRMDAMDRVLNGPVIQFLGRISYSLYLVHLTFGWRFISLVKHQFGPRLNPVEGTATLLGGVMVSVLASWVMYRLIEAPSMAVARRVRLPRRAAASPL